MYIIEEHYCSINKIVLRALGIWPHDKSCLALFQQIIIFLLTTTHIVLQLSIFITKKCDMALFLRTVSLLFPSLLITLKYCVFIYKSKAMINLHYMIEEDWKMLRNKIESEIIQKYAQESRLYIIRISLLTCTLEIIATIMQFLPKILDAVLPLDEPRPHKLFLSVEYFAFQDKFFYMKLLHELVFMFICGTIVSAIGLHFIAFTCHCFGMFKIASYRIEHSIEDSILHTTKLNKDSTIRRNIKQVVIAHRRAMKFSDIFISTFDAPYCLIAIVGVLSLSINLYRFVEAATITQNMSDAIISFIIAIAHLIYMYVANYLGQKVIDCNDEIFRLTYGTSWYLMSASSQKFILFLMQKSGKEFYFMIGMIFIAKIESFASLTNTALSYLAVMLSVQR